MWKSIVGGLLILGLVAGTSNAAIIHDESVDGDHASSDPGTLLGSFGNGSSIIGSISATGTGSDEADRFRFNLTEDLTFTVSVSNTDEFFVNTLIFINPGLPPEFRSTVRGPGPFSLTQGSYIFALVGDLNTGNFDYRIDFGDVSAVPVPAALPLLATAFAGFGFMGWRKHRTA